MPTRSYIAAPACVIYTYHGRRHLDGKHVVFGAVTKGMGLVKLVESYGSSGGDTSADVRIADCGQQNHIIPSTLPYAFEKITHVVKQHGFPATSGP